MNPFFDENEYFDGKGSGGWRGCVGYCLAGTVFVEGKPNPKVLGCGKIVFTNGKLPDLKIQVWMDDRLASSMNYLDALKDLLRQQAMSGDIQLE